MGTTDEPSLIEASLWAPIPSLLKNARVHKLGSSRSARKEEKGEDDRMSRQNGHERKEGDGVWGPMGREPDEKGQAGEQPSFIQEPLANTSCVGNYAARRGGRGREKERRKERGHPSTNTKKEEREGERKKEQQVFPVTTNESRDAPQMGRLDIASRDALEKGEKKRRKEGNKGRVRFSQLQHKRPGCLGVTSRDAPKR